MENKEAQPPYTSKTKRGKCKNEDCTNPRRKASAYCQPCADKHKLPTNPSIQDEPPTEGVSPGNEEAQPDAPEEARMDAREELPSERANSESSEGENKN